jgi:hypothetical protein
MRRRGDVLGAVNLFMVRPARLAPDAATVARALAAVATIGLLQQRALRDRETLIEQLQTALTSRVLIEQAKGVLAERHGLDVQRACAALRRHARAHNHRLTDLARAIVHGGQDIIPEPATRTREPDENPGPLPDPRA